MKSVRELLEEHDWQQIPNCRGRFTMTTPDPELSLEGLLGSDCEPMEVSSVMARDAILVVPLEGGGVISYRRENGSFVHTLNTPDGFWRKLRDLGIDHHSLM